MTKLETPQPRAPIRKCPQIEPGNLRPAAFPLDWEVTATPASPNARSPPPLRRGKRSNHGPPPPVRQFDRISVPPRPPSPNVGPSPRKSRDLLHASGFSLRAPSKAENFLPTFPCAGNRS